MNMISTGAFQNEMDASKNLPTLAEKFAAVWEKKNAKAARAGGVSLMALSLAACGSDDSTATTSTTTSTTTTVTTTDAAQVLALKTTIDKLDGGSGDDIFSGSAGTIDGDILTGGAGSDTLSLSLTNADDNNSSFKSDGIETISVRTTNGNVVLDFGDVTDMDTFVARRLAGNIQADNVTLDTTIRIENTSAGTLVDVNFDAGSITGTADSASVILDTNADVDADIDGIETINISTVDGASVVGALTGDKITKIVTSGAEKLTVSSVTGAGALTVDTTAATGATKFVLAAGDHTYTGGAAADTVDFGTTLTVADTVTGGTGSDTIMVTGAGGAVMPALAAVTGVENITITTGGGDSYDADIVSIGAINVVAAANAHTIAITDVTTETIAVTTTTPNVAGATDDDIADVNIQLKDATGAADSLTVTFTNQDLDNEMEITTSDFGTSGNIETLNLVFNQGADVPGVGVEDIDLADLNTTHTTVNVSGNADVAIGTGTAIVSKIVDASALTGDLEFSAGAVDSTLTGGSGTNTFTFAGNLTSLDTVTGGAGADTLTATMAAVNAAATITGVETFKLDMANAGNNFNGVNVAGITTLELQGSVANVVSNLAATATTINLIEEADDETVAITYATGSNSDITINFDETANGGTEDYAAITVSGNAGSTTINSVDGAYTVTSFVAADTTGTFAINTTDALVVDGTAGVDAVKATGLAITTGGGNFDVSGAATNSFTKATSINLQALSGDILIDNASGVLVTDADVTVDMLARNTGNLIDVTTLNVDHVTTMNLTAENGGDVVITDLNMLGKNSATTAVDVATLINMTATGTGSSVTISDVTPASATTLDSVVMTSSDKGVVSFTAADDNLTLTAIDASGAAADGVVISVADLGAATTITVGAGNSTITTSDNATDSVITGSGNATINSTAGGTFSLGVGGSDTFTARSAASDNITGFEIANDTIVIDKSDIDGFGSSNTPVDSGAATLGALTAPLITSHTGGTAFTMGTGSILRMNGTHANTAAIELLLEGDLNDASFADEDALVVIWSDGANAHIDLFEIDAVNTTSSGVADTVTYNGEIAELIGVDASKLTDANFDIVA
jgi:hypothetical protein